MDLKMDEVEGDRTVLTHTDPAKGYELRSQLLEITTALKIYDKLSIIFLLSDKASTGLEIMDSILSEFTPRKQNNKFYKWFKQQLIVSNKNWKEGLAEVLSIVQNYRLAKVLGFSKEDIKDIKEHRVCNVREILYELCEELNKDNYSQLVTLVESGSYEPLQGFLEYNLFYWASQKRIALDNNTEIDVNAILKPLESLGFKNLTHKIEFEVEKHNCQLLRKKSLRAEPSLFEYYQIIDKSNLGLCVIISEKNFSKFIFPKRWGTDKDVHRLVEIFTAFGFDIHVHTDLTSEQLINTLSHYAETIHDNISFFVLIILSHGSENIIYTSDSQPVDISTIETMFQAENCPKLIGKPKTFIVQACQGEKWQQVFTKNEDSDIEADNIKPPSRSKVTVGPQKGDSMIAWSTVQGYASFRDKYNGSWYVEELCNELWKFGDAFDLVEIFTRVNSNLRSKVYNGQFMVPSLQLSLRAKVQFPMLRENVLKGKRLMLERLLFEKYFRKFLVDTGSLELLTKFG